MKLAKKILQHNINNFRHSVSLHHQLYLKGMESRVELVAGLLNCIKERFKFFHWTPSTF